MLRRDLEPNVIANFEHPTGILRHVDFPIIAYYPIHDAGTEKIACLDTPAQSRRFRCGWSGVHVQSLRAEQDMYGVTHGPVVLVRAVDFAQSGFDPAPGKELAGVDVRRAHEIRDVKGAWAAIQALGGVELREATVEYDRHPVGQLHRLDLVVGDENGRDPKRFCRSRMKRRISSLSLVSRFASGSSIIRTEGFVISVRATATRCICPPESCAGNRSRNGVSCTTSRISSSLLAISVLDSPLTLGPKATFFSTVMCGNSAYRWNTMPTLRS